MVMEIVISLVLLLVGIAVLLAIHVCIVRRAFREAYEDGGESVRNRDGSKRVSNEDLKHLPCFEYKAGKTGTTTSLDCAVCLENFRGGDECRLLPNCKHSFHVQCIDSWLIKTPFCPICRSCIYSPRIGLSLREESGVSGNGSIELT